jgi:hypothetical protein
LTFPKAGDHVVHRQGLAAVAPCVEILEFMEKDDGKQYNENSNYRSSLHIKYPAG